MRLRTGLLALGLLLSAEVAGADGGTSETCIEHLPSGKARPALTESFPAKGLSGHALTLEVIVEHGKGETVAPSGFRPELGGTGLTSLERAGFSLPHPDGGAGPTITVDDSGANAKSTVHISFVALPAKPGRQTLTLPPLPIAISRASGDLITLCTQPHEITIEDPIANTPDPKPRDNPDPRREREEWTALKHALYGGGAALLLFALAAALLTLLMRRKKPPPPPPPPRPPWETALEDLADVRQARLVERERFAEHYGRVANIVRRYCGERYGFDGLESTTRETMNMLRRIVPPVPVLDEIERFLKHADLVKFARLTPSAEECTEALALGELIVQRTVPIPGPAYRATGNAWAAGAYRAGPAAGAPPPQPTGAVPMQWPHQQPPETEAATATAGEAPVTGGEPAANEPTDAATVDASASVDPSATGAEPTANEPADAAPADAAPAVDPTPEDDKP